MALNDQIFTSLAWDAIHALSERGMCPAGSAMIRKHLSYFGFESGNLV
jgi:hypothetical protein